MAARICTLASALAAVSSGLVCKSWQIHVRRATVLAATADEATERARRDMALKQQQYEASQLAASKASVSSEQVPSLAELAFIPFVDDCGQLSECGASASTRASVYAIFDEAKELVHVGKSRDATRSLRSILVRQPELSHYFKVFHVSKPSRNFLDVVAETWLQNSTPLGNDGAEGQRSFEAPMDFKPLMTDDDRADLEAAKQIGKEKLAFKKVAVRYEAHKLNKLKARGFDVSSIKFDSKLKGQGLLDLKAA